MAKKTLIEIDDALCTGCGQCVAGCHEGALAIVDGKARLVAADLCDGLGACLRECPEGALRLIEIDDELPDASPVPGPTEAAVSVSRWVPEVSPSNASNTCDCGALERIMAVLEGATPPDPNSPRERTTTPLEEPASPDAVGGHSPIPIVSGAQSIDPPRLGTGPVQISTGLRQWPIKMELIDPTSPVFAAPTLVILADCAAVAYTALHLDLLPGNPVVTTCPKFGDAAEITAKLRAIVTTHKPRTIYAVRMTVACCRGVLRLLANALEGLQDAPEVFEVVVPLPPLDGP